VICPVTFALCDLYCERAVIGNHGSLSSLKLNYFSICLKLYIPVTLQGAERVRNDRGRDPKIIPKKRSVAPGVSGGGGIKA